MAVQDYSFEDSGSEAGNNNERDEPLVQESDGVDADDEEEGEEHNRIADTLSRINLARDSASDSENEIGNPDEDNGNSSSSASSDPNSEDEGDDDIFDYLRLDMHIHTQYEQSHH